MTSNKHIEQPRYSAWLPETFSRRLKRIRSEHGLSMTGLAKRSGVSRGYIYILEDCAGNPTLDKLAKICAALDLTPSKFLEDVDFSDFT